MKVIVDTSIWSLALRRKNVVDSAYIVELQELVKELRVQMIGAIRQEVLSGIKLESQFHTLKLKLSAFSALVHTETDFELAAEFFNFLRSKGIQGSDADFFDLCGLGKPSFTHF